MVSGVIAVGYAALESAVALEGRAINLRSLGLWEERTTALIVQAIPMATLCRLSFSLLHIPHQTGSTRSFSELGRLSFSICLFRCVF
jgi:hypothetical protein